MQVHYGNQTYPATEERCQHFEALHRSALCISRHLESEVIMQQALEQVYKVLNVEAAAISIVDPESNELVIRAQRGLKSFAHRPVRLPKGVGLAWATLLNKETITIDSWEDEPRLAVPAFLEEHIRATILVPMFNNGNPVGVLSAMSRGNRTFTLKEQALLAGIAEHVANALHNAQLYEQAQQQSQECAFLFKLATTITPLRNIDQIAHEVLTQTLGYLNWPMGIVLTEDLESHTVVSQAQVGYASALQALTTRATDIGRSAAPILTSQAAHPILATMLHIPLHTANHMYGWLAFGTTESVEVHKHITDTLSAAGNYVSIVLENLHTYHKVLERERRSEILHTLTHTLTVDNACNISQQILRTLSQSISYEVGGILLTDRPLRVLYLRHKIASVEHAHIVSRLYRLAEVPADFEAQLTPENCIELHENGKPITPGQVLAFVEAPLTRGQDQIGAILLARHRPFTDYERQIFSTVAYQFGQVLLTTRLSEQVERQAQQLEVAYRQLDGCENEQRTILSDLVYKLNIPVTFLKSYAELLLDGSLGTLNQAQMQAVNHILKQAEFFTGLTHDLNMLAISADKLQYQPTAIADLLQRATHKVQSLLKNKNIALVTECDAGLPLLVVDPQRMGRVLEGLLGQAICVTPQGGKICLRVGQEDKAAVRLSIIANGGPSIPVDELDLIFKRLYHEKLERLYPGISIELALAKCIVESHRGTIGVQNNDGGGSTFHIVLPVHPQATAGKHSS